MDYENLYKNALERARVWKEKSGMPADKQGILDDIFPELKEPEDEKVRKEIISFLKSPFINDNICDWKVAPWIAWLENIPYTIDHEKREGFHLGYKAALEKQSESSIKWNKNTEGNKPQVNHSVLMKTFQGIAEGEWKGEYWEQYRWAGIVRDRDVLSWIELSDLEKQGEQKTAWNEDDKKEYKYVLKFVDNILNNCGNKKDYEHCKRCYDWLKSLKERRSWSPSDEQVVVLELASKYERVFTPKQIDILIGLKEQLKKLKG